MENRAKANVNQLKDIQAENSNEANGKPGTSYAEDTQKNIKEAEGETLENKENADEHSSQNNGN